jgi:hypothetical protein
MIRSMSFKMLAHWLVLVGATICCLVAFGYPMYVIQPFKYQPPLALSIALEVRQWGPWASILFCGLALYSAKQLWRSSRIVVSLLVVLAIAAAALTHVNVFEQMFHPIDQVQMVAGAQAKLETDDMVLAVRVGGQARAYPVRMMAYHHIVNDWVGGIPLVGTY